MSSRLLQMIPWGHKDYPTPVSRRTLRLKGKGSKIRATSKPKRK